MSARTTTAQRIIEATLQLMAERGLAGMTMSAVAKTAGIARQTLYNHFDSVEQIVAASLAAHQVNAGDDLHAVLATIEEPEAQLAHLVRHAAASAVLHAPLPAFRHGLSAEMRQTMAHHDHTMQSMIVDILDRGTASGAFRDDLVVERDAQLIHAMLQRVTEIVGTDPDAAGDVVATSTRTMLAAVQ